MDVLQRERICSAIRQSDMILIGVGEEMAPALPDFQMDARIRPFAVSSYLASLDAEHPTVRAYRKLRTVTGKKPYFAVTLNTDDLILRGGFWKDLVVAPCGSVARMQCGSHIVEAAPVCEQVLAAFHDGQDGHTGSDPEDILAQYACCPRCGAPLQFHLKALEGYLEEGYLTQWQYYNNWLTCTLNRRLCILELGVGFQYPQVIRWPFERLAYYNQKATLIRVHSRLPQTAAELGDRGISVKSAPDVFLEELVDAYAQIAPDDAAGSV